MSDDWTYKIEIKKGAPEARHGVGAYLSTLLTPWLESHDELKTKVKLQAYRNENNSRGFLDPLKICERAAELFADVIIELQCDPVDFGSPEAHEFGPGTGAEGVSVPEALVAVALDLASAVDEADGIVDPSPWLAEIRRHDVDGALSSNESFLSLEALQSEIKTAQQEESEVKERAAEGARDFLENHQVAKIDHFNEFGEAIAKIESVSLSLYWVDEESAEYQWELRLWTSESEEDFINRVKDSGSLEVLFDWDRRVVVKAAEILTLDRLPGVVYEGDCWNLNEGGEFEDEDYKEPIFETGDPASREGKVFFKIDLSGDEHFSRLSPGEATEDAVNEMADRLRISDSDAIITTYHSGRHEVARLAFGDFFICGFWFADGFTLIQRINAATGGETHFVKIEGSLSNLIGNPASDAVVVETIHENKCLVQILSSEDLGVRWSEDSSFSSFSIGSNSSRLFRCNRRGDLDIHDFDTGQVSASVSQEVPIDRAQVVVSEDRVLVLGDSRETENEGRAFQYSIDGELLNSATFPVEAFPSCVLENGQVIIGRTGKVAFRFDDLSTVWKNDEESYLILTSGNQIFTQVDLETGEKAIVSLDGVTGDEIWRSPIPDFKAEVGVALKDGSLILSDYQEKGMIVNSQTGERLSSLPNFFGGAVAAEGIAVISDRASGFEISGRITDFSSLLVQLSSPPVDFQWIVKWEHDGRQGSRNSFIDISPPSAGFSGFVFAWKNGKDLLPWFQQFCPKISPEGLDVRIMSVIRGHKLIQQASMWEDPAIGGEATGSVRGRQWRLVMAFSGLERLVKSLRGTKGGVDRSLLECVCEILELPEFGEIGSPSLEKGSVTKWLESEEGPDEIIAFLGIENGDHSCFDSWFLQSKPVDDWVDGLLLAKAFRNATAHGSLSPTKVSDWGLASAFDKLLEVILAVDKALFDKGISD